MSNVAAKLKASFKVTPRDSHVVLVVLALIGGICLLVGFAFLWQNVDYPWIPIVLGVGMLIVVGVLWVLSYEDVDARSSASTHIASSDGGRQITVTTDARSLHSRERMEALERVISMVLRRHPLPDPDGLVDASGEPVPGSESAAKARVKTANDEAKQIFDSVFVRDETVENDRAFPGEKATEQHALNESPGEEWSSEGNQPGRDEDT